MRSPCSATRTRSSRWCGSSTTMRRPRRRSRRRSRESSAATKRHPRRGADRRSGSQVGHARGRQRPGRRPRGAAGAARPLVTVLGWLRGPAVERALTRLLGDAERARDRDRGRSSSRRRTGDRRHPGQEAAPRRRRRRRLAAIVALGRAGRSAGHRGGWRRSMLDGDRAEIVAAALGACPDRRSPRASTRCCRCCRTSDAAVRQAAIGALNSLGIRKAARVAVRLLSGRRDPLRARIARCGSRDTSAIARRVHTVIERAGTDPDEGVRRAAVEHLPFLDDPRAVGGWLRRFGTDGRPRCARRRRRRCAHVSSAAARGAAPVGAGRSRSPGSATMPCDRLAELQEAVGGGRGWRSWRGTDPAMHVRIAALGRGALGPCAAWLPVACCRYADAPTATWPRPRLARARAAWSRIRAAAPALAAALRSPDPAATARGRDRAALDRRSGRRAVGARLDGRRRPRRHRSDGGGGGARRDRRAPRRRRRRRDRRADRRDRGRAAARSRRSPRLARRPADADAARVAEGLGHRQPDDPLRDDRRAGPDAASGCLRRDADRARRRGGGGARGGRSPRSIGSARAPRSPRRADGRRDPSRAVRRAAAAALGRVTDAPAKGGLREERYARWRPTDSLGLSSSALPLLRDLIHERMGVFYDDTAASTRCADRLAPLVVERGFDSFLDYYYLLKYDEDAAAEWERVMDALSVPETYFWREIDQIRGDRRRRSCRTLAGAAGGAAAHLVRAVRDRRGAADDRDGARGGGLVRSRARSRSAPATPARRRSRGPRAGRYRERSFRTLPPALRESYFRDDRAGPGRSARRCSAGSRRGAWSTCVAATRRSRRWRGRRSSSAATCSSTSRRRRSAQRRRRVRADAMPSPGYLCVGASESLLRVTTRFELEDRRRVRLRQATWQREAARGIDD